MNSLRNPRIGTLLASNFIPSILFLCFMPRDNHYLEFYAYHFCARLLPKSLFAIGCRLSWGSSKFSRKY